MKRFQFQLERLLRYHQQRQKQAELILVRIGREQEMARATVQDLERRIESAGQLSERIGRPIDPALREQSLRYARRLGETLQEAQEILKGLERRFREAQSRHTAVTQQVEALQQLRSRRWQEHLDEAARQQQIELDDVVMKQWSRRTLMFGSTLATAESTAVTQDQKP